MKIKKITWRACLLIKFKAITFKKHAFEKPFIWNLLWNINKVSSDPNEETLFVFSLKIIFLFKKKMFSQYEIYPNIFFILFYWNK